MITNTKATAARPRTFGRLGTDDDIKRQSEMVIEAGGKITRDIAAGTIIATVQGREAFRAIRKGEAGQPWLFIYSREFYKP